MEVHMPQRRSSAPVTRKCCIACAALALGGAPAAATTIQDIARIKGHEQNVLTGLGIVVGLNGSGDKGKDSIVASLPMARLLENMGAGVTNLDDLSKADAFALVQVTMTIPPTGAREGDLIDVYVEAIYNAKSLAGGRLVPSMLRLPLPDSPDLLPLAMATGAISIEGDNPRAGVIRRGGQVLRDDQLRASPVSRAGAITLVLSDQYAGYPVASMVADAINDEFVLAGQPELAFVQDAKNIRVSVPDADLADPAGFIATVMTIQIDPSVIQTPARVVVNERVGTIVVSGTVELSPVAITHEGLAITTITPTPVPSAQDPVYETTAWTMLDPTDGTSRASARLTDLLRAFKQLNVPVEDQIALLYQLKEAGALHAEIVRE
jgi:flagellar P-ring protein precursor FlgI